MLPRAHAKRSVGERRARAGGVQGAVRDSHLAKKSKDKTPRVFFHAAFDFDTPRPRNTEQNSKKQRKNEFIKN